MHRPVFLLEVNEKKIKEEIDSLLYKARAIIWNILEC